MIWEYKTIRSDLYHTEIDYKTHNQFYTLEPILKKLGEEGWELVSTSVYPGKKDVLIFKRPDPNTRFEQKLDGLLK